MMRGKAWVSSEIERWIVRLLPLVIGRSLKSGLHGVYRRGAWDALPETGAMLALNHHSWWDAYLCWLIRAHAPAQTSGIMTTEQLERFPFFRRVGVISDKNVREALRRLARGDTFLIFPEGSLQQAGHVGEVKRGVAFLARRSGVPVYPVACRVVLRGAQRPEAFLVLGEPLERALDDAALLETLKANLDALLLELDAQVAATPPETPLTGFEPLLSGALDFNKRMGRLRHFWS